MSTHANNKLGRVLAIAPSTHGFGFAVFEGRQSLIDWGGKGVTGDKNEQSLRKIEKFISLYCPSVLVLEDTAAKESRRAPRIRCLTLQIKALALERKVRVKLISNETVRKTFFGKDHRSKHILAGVIAQQFPDELASRVPPKRKPWMSEDSRLDIFAAMALGLAHYTISS